MDLVEKELRLIARLKEMGKVLIAFSGGVDSTYLAAIAYKTLGDNAFAVTLFPEYVPARELNEATELANLIGIKHQIIPLNSLSNQDIVDNPPDRCFYCKTELFTGLKELATSLDIQYVLDGSNTDDLKDFRPGLKALKNLGIVSPLKEADLAKAEIRVLSKELNLPTWNKASFSCIATRIPYGESLDIKKIKQIEAAEDLLYSLEVPQFRVRHHGNMARIEVLPDDFDKIIKHHDQIVVRYKELGFENITLDLQGYRTGSMNDALKKAE